MAKLLTYDGQVIDPTAYIYIYIYDNREREKRGPSPPKKGKKQGPPKLES